MWNLFRLSLVVSLVAVSFAAESAYFKFVMDGRNLRAEDAVKLESALESDPENSESRARLLGYYSAAEAGKDRELASSAYASRLQHLFWVIERHPESELATIISPSPALGTDSERQQQKDLWRGQTERFPRDARVLKNAALFELSQGERDAALSYLKQAATVDPNDPQITTPLGAWLAETALEFHTKNKARAERSRLELQNCANASLCGSAGQTVSMIVRNRRGNAEFRQEDEDLAAKLLMTAQNLDPGNPQWSQRLAELKLPAEALLRASQGGILGGIIGGLPNAGATGQPLDTPSKIRIGGNVQAANILKQAPPVYPPLAKQARIQGTVRFNATIAKDGTIESLQLVSGHPLLVQTAQDAVRQWVYKPTLLNGEPVIVLTTIDVNFTLNDGPSEPPPAQ